MSINHLINPNINPRLDIYVKDLSIDGSFDVTTISADSIEAQTISTNILNGGISPDIIVNANLDLGGTGDIDNCKDLEADKVDADELVARRTYNPNNILFSNPIGSRIVLPPTFFQNNTDAFLQLSREERVENPSGNRIEVLTYSGSFKTATLATSYDIYFDVIFLTPDKSFSWTPADFRGCIKQGNSNPPNNARVIAYIHDVNNLTTDGMRLNFRNSTFVFTTPYANIDFTFSVYRTL